MIYSIYINIIKNTLAMAQTKIIMDPFYIDILLLLVGSELCVFHQIYIQIY